MIMKKNIKRDAESQVVEDALCLGEHEARDPGALFSVGSPRCPF